MDQAHDLAFLRTSRRGLEAVSGAGELVVASWPVLILKLSPSSLPASSS